MFQTAMLGRQTADRNFAFYADFVGNPGVSGSQWSSAPLGRPAPQRRIFFLLGLTSGDSNVDTVTIAGVPANSLGRLDAGELFFADVPNGLRGDITYSISGDPLNDDPSDSPSNTRTLVVICVTYPLIMVDLTSSSNFEAAENSSTGSQVSFPYSVSVPSLSSGSSSTMAIALWRRRGANQYTWDPSFPRIMGALNSNTGDEKIVGFNKQSDNQFPLVVTIDAEEEGNNAATLACWRWRQQEGDGSVFDPGED